MSGIVRRLGRDQQPNQEWVPPAPQFASDMVVAHIGNSLTVMNPRTGAVDGVFTTMSSEPAGPPFVYADTIGLALDLTHDRAILSSNFADTDSFTVLTWLKPYAGGLAALRTWFRRGSDSWGGWSIYFGNNSSGIPFIAVVLTAGGTTYYDAVGSSALSDTEWTAVAGTFDAASGVLKLFVNGVLAATTSTGNSVLRSSGFNLFMGGDTDSTGGNYFGRRGPMFVLKRAMLDAEVANHSSNPWLFLEPEQIYVPFVASGGGAAALEGSLAASGAVSGALTTAIQAAASVSASATVTAALTTAIRPAASVSAGATVSAALTTAIQMAGSLSATASVSGDISGAAALASSVSTSAIVTGALSTAIRLNASIAGAATVSATLTDAVAAALAASITASATVSASLTGGSSTIWTPASASSGTWTPASAAGGTWVAQ